MIFKNTLDSTYFLIIGSIAFKLNGKCECCQRQEGSELGSWGLRQSVHTDPDRAVPEPREFWPSATKYSEFLKDARNRDFYMKSYNEFQYK